MRVLQPVSKTGRSILGIHLLALCEVLASRVPMEKPDGEGDRDSPFRPIKLAHWIWCWRNSQPPEDAGYYYEIGGHLIFKDSRHYVSDVRPAENGYEYLIKEPKYRQVRDVFEGVEDLNLQETFSSPGVSMQMGNILQGQYNQAQVAGPDADGNIARLANYLPAVTAAMLIAEPSRNKRAWPINMMIIDLIRNSVWRYSWSEIFWHPLDGRSWTELPFGVEDIGPMSKSKKDRAIGDITLASDLHLIGGRMPSSPTGGGEFGKTPLSSTQGKPGNQKEVFNVSIKYDYVHQKEIDVLFDWLMAQSAVMAVWKEDNMQNVDNSIYTKSDKAGKQYWKSSDVINGSDPAINVIRTEIKRLMSNI